MKLLLWLLSTFGLACAESYWNFGTIGGLQSADEPSGETSCSCGWVNRGRIIAGTETRQNEYPMMVSLQIKRRDTHLCGGTILTPWHVLTAAHCTYGSRPQSLAIVVGAHDITLSENQRVLVSRIINHERYNSFRLRNDIALLVTASEIKFNQLVGPACLPAAKLHLDGQRLKAVGWGAQEFQGNSSDVLLEADLTVVNSNQCLLQWWKTGNVVVPHPDNNLCTFDRHMDTCQGDSGGPLLWLDPDNSRYTIAALVSYGDSCAGNLPAVNTDVSAYIDWINRRIEGWLHRKCLLLDLVVFFLIHSGIVLDVCISVEEH